MTDKTKEQAIDNLTSELVQAVKAARAAGLTNNEVRDEIGQLFEALGGQKL